MTMQVRVSDQTLLPELVESLLRNDCVAHAVGPDSCAVVHVRARDAQEAWVEVGFYLRAWELRHRAQVTLSH